MRFRSAVAIGGAAILTLWAAVNLTSPNVAIEPFDRRIGGLSGLVVLDGGNRFVAIGDKGVLVRGQLVRRDGVLRRAVHDSVDELRNPAGEVLDRLFDDAEGLDVTPGGQVIASLEHLHRVAIFDGATREHRLARFPDRYVPHQNATLESLALDDQGRPIVIVEGVWRGPEITGIYRLDLGVWHEIGKLRLSDGFAPVGSDFGPDGTLYILERQVGVLGFRSRIRRVALTPGTVMEGEVVWAPTRGMGNLEGLSVWQTAAGDLRATMVADNNFLPLLPKGLTEITLARGTGAE